MKKITLLAASALLLLTACGQVENSPAEVVPPLAIETQEDVRQPQAAPKPATAVKELDTVSDAAQEQTQEQKASQTETVPQAAQPPEPVKEPTPAENIPSRLSTPRPAMWSRSLLQNRNLRSNPQPQQTGKQPLMWPMPTRSRSTAWSRTAA